jgi:hypothetical protein
MFFHASSRSKWLRPTGPFAIAALALSTVLACDDEEEATGIPVEQFVAELRGATCERLVRCTYAPDQASCEAAIPTDRGVVQAVASVISGDLTYDPIKGRACVDAVRQHKCEGDYFLPRTLRETCDAVFGNRKGEGAACFSGSECQGVDADCEKEADCLDACCQGVCKLAGGTAGVGAPCDAKTPCSPDLVCLANEGGGSGDGGGPEGNRSCQPRVGPGSQCSDPFECSEGYGCDPATNTCFKQADSKATCNPMLAAPGCAAQAEYCDTATSTCVPLPGDGQPCVTNGFVTDACALYAQCVMGTCQRLPSADQPCLNGECLGLLQCSSGEGGGQPQDAVCLPLQPAPVCVL